MRPHGFVDSRFVVLEGMAQFRRRIVRPPRHFHACLIVLRGLVVVGLPPCVKGATTRFMVLPLAGHLRFLPADTH